MRVPSFLLIMLVMRSECKVGREERVEVVVASYSGEMEALLRQAVRGGQQGLAVSLLLGEVSSLSRILQDPIHNCAELQAVAYPPQIEGTEERLKRRAFDLFGLVAHRFGCW